MYNVSGTEGLVFITVQMDSLIICSSFKLQPLELSRVGLFEVSQGSPLSCFY